MQLIDSTRRAATSSRVGLILLLACLASMLLFVAVLVVQY